MQSAKLASKPSEKDGFPICLTFEREEKLKIYEAEQKQDPNVQNYAYQKPQTLQKTELRFLDQRRDFHITERQGTCYLLDHNTKVIDIIKGGAYLGILPMIVSGSYFGQLDQPSSSDYLTFYGTNETIRSYDPNTGKDITVYESPYVVKILNVKLIEKMMEDKLSISQPKSDSKSEKPTQTSFEKIRKINRKDRKDQLIIKHGFITSDNKFAVFVFEDGYTVTFKGSNFCASDDVKEAHSAIYVKASQIFVTGHDYDKGTVNLMYFNDEGLYLIDKARVDALDKSREGANAYKGKILNVLYHNPASRCYIIEQQKDEIWVVNFDLERKTMLSSVRLLGEIRGSALLGDQIFIYVYQVGAKNMLTNEEAPLSNHLFVYDMQNKYIAYKEVKGSLKLFSVTVSETGFYYVIQNAPDTDSKGLARIQANTQQEKMNRFLEKSYFEIAFKFAQNEGHKELLPKICSLAGDHYYKMKNYELAVQQYIKEIELIGNSSFSDYEFDPNAIITKFLDVSRMPYLIDYLYALHFSPHNLTNSYHQQLLCYCYLKKEMYQELDAWLSRMKTNSSQADFENLITMVVSSCLYAKKRV